MRDTFRSEHAQELETGGRREPEVRASIPTETLPLDQHFQWQRRSVVLNGRRGRNPSCPIMREAAAAV